MQFTKTTLAALALPEGKADHVVWDDDLPGFGLRLRGDTRRWVVQYRIAGQSRRESIGDPRRVSLEEARRIARQRFGIVAQGLDPAADKTRAKAEAEAARLTLAVGPAPTDLAKSARTSANISLQTALAMFHTVRPLAGSTKPVT